MSSRVVPVYYDFAATLCYVAHRVMDQMAGDLQELHIDLEWRPIDLAQIVGWQRGAPVDPQRRDNALRCARDLGVAVRMPTYWLDSRGAGAVALALAGTTKEPTWRERVWSAAFEEGRDIGDADELARLARDIGLEVTVVDLDKPDRLDADTRRAHQAGVTGVPTFMLGDWPMGGIQEPPTMRSVLERFLRRNPE